MSRRLERSAQQISIKYQTNYSFVLELLEMVGKNETLDILKMKPKDLRQTARVNLLKNSRADLIANLKSENIIAKPVDNLPEAIEITKSVAKLGSSQAYLKGEVMPQGLGSMYTVDALDPQPGETILDMAAAPGGKSCFIAERMQNEGILYANDISTRRFRSLLFNIARLGLENVVYSNQDAKKIGFDGIDRILLDAPCTGGGLLVSKPYRRSSRDLSDSMQLQRLQIQLLQHALRLLEPGGVCVYSTCAISPLENELVIDRIKSKVIFEPQSGPGVNSLLDDDVIGKRYYPHLHGCDGFFIVRMRKE